MCSSLWIGSLRRLRPAAVRVNKVCDKFRRRRQHTRPCERSRPLLFGAGRDLGQGAAKQATRLSRGTTPNATISPATALTPIGLSLQRYRTPQSLGNLGAVSLFKHPARQDSDTAVCGGALTHCALRSHRDQKQISQSVPARNFARPLPLDPRHSHKVALAKLHPLRAQDRVSRGSVKIEIRL